MSTLSVVRGWGKNLHLMEKAFLKFYKNVLTFRNLYSIFISRLVQQDCPFFQGTVWPAAKLSSIHSCRPCVHKFEDQIQHLILSRYLFRYCSLHAPSSFFSLLYLTCTELLLSCSFASLLSKLIVPAVTVQPTGFQMLDQSQSFLHQPNTYYRPSQASRHGHNYFHPLRPPSQFVSHISSMCWIGTALPSTLPVGKTP